MFDSWPAFLIRSSARPGGWLGNVAFVGSKRPQCSKADSLEGRLLARSGRTHNERLWNGELWRKSDIG
jgi:hypothetical protein